MKIALQKCKFIIFLLLILVSCDPNNETPEVNNITGHPVLSRDEVLLAWENIYLATEITDPQWDGSWQDCNAGTLPESVHNKVLARINFYRVICGLSGDVVFDDDLNEKCQQAALMFHANSSLSHDPPTNWHCWTIDGHEAAKNSNIGFGTEHSPIHTTNAVDKYIQDENSGNLTLGHRRWLLFSRAKTMGHGSTSQANAIWVGGNNGNPQPEDLPDFIAYPPPGYTPIPLIYKFWSLSVPNANFHDASVVMKDQNGNEVQCEITHTSGPGDPIIGDNSINWIPSICINNDDDNTFSVKVENVVLFNEITSYNYEVIIIPIEK